MPVRKVANHGSNIIGRYPYLKMGRMVAFESTIKRDYIYLLDYEPAVTSFAEQPLTIEFSCDGAVFHYTPDFHVVENGLNVLVECKPVRFMDTDENQRKFVAALEWCANCGWSFQIVSDKQLRAGYRLRNIKLLTPFARYWPDQQVQSQ